LNNSLWVLKSWYHILGIDPGLSKASANPTVGCVRQGLYSLPVTEPADYISAAFKLARFVTIADNLFIAALAGFKIRKL
jgi:hypothetical protein